MVILGNPPYQRNSQNNGKWITKLMEDYKKEPNSKQKLDEDNPKNINDDYVKFIRYSQYMIDKNKEGMLAFINPNGYLESATFRGVRWSLLSSFDEIYILNLHGNSRKGENSSKDSAEENVFDIQTGVCINIFVRKKNHNGLAKVFYSDLYGKRKDKYDWLVAHSFSDTQWKEITPVAPHYLFTPLSNDDLEDYHKGVRLSDLFPVNCNGFTTHRDKFAVAFTKEEIETRVSDLLSSDYTEGEIKEKYNISDNRDWKLNVARSLLKSQVKNEYISKCLYRPFDYRWCYLNKVFMDFPRVEIVSHVLNKENLCLLVPRQQSKEGFKHAFISDLPTEPCLISTATSEQNSVFPLYLYSTGLLNEKRVNIAKKEANKLLKKIGLTIEENKKNSCKPDDLMYYVYAVLYSDQYREKYSKYCKSDFPYIPVPKTKDYFYEMAKLGKELADIHLMKIKINYTDLKTTFDIEGDNIVDKPRFASNSVYINKNQLFGNVSEEIFNFIIGGHQPAKLWLKQRKGKKLTSEEIIHYQKILYSLEKTIQIMEQIKLLDN